ncbi:universal stress protein [Rubrobacter marinus]|uniref:universal stress protein n=1 Tax=Rubrobacter marinus TaxID=2653852 RepID=UPI001D18E33C|nr:universal stress protein [Rubrobacter marinus]
MFPTKILLAVDGSEESMRAARKATALSRGSGSELHVVYVEPVDIAGPEREIYPLETREDLFGTFGRFARERLDELTEEVRKSGGDITQAHAKVGRPDKEIVRLAEELGAELVVLGSRGFGTIRRALLGSVSTSVVRLAHCPVLVVRGDEVAEQDRAFTKILLAVDGSEESRAAADAAAEISEATAAELHLLFVMETAPLNPYAPYLGPEAWEVSADVLEKRNEKMRAFLRREAERVEAKGIEVEEAHLTSGVPAKEIVGAAEELGADLVVLGSRGLGAVKRALLGSVSDSVVCHAHCPVLVVRGRAQQTEEQPADVQARTAEVSPG